MSVHPGPVEPGQVWSTPGSDGEAFRRVRVLCAHPDGGWVVEDLPARMRLDDRRPFRCPDFNLRMVMAPEPPSS